MAMSSRTVTKVLRRAVQALACQISYGRLTLRDVDGRENKRPEHQFEHAVVPTAAVMLPLRVRCLWDIGELELMGQVLAPGMDLSLELSYNRYKLLHRYLLGRGQGTVNVANHHLGNLVCEAPERDLRKEKNTSYLRPYLPTRWCLGAST